MLLRKPARKNFETCSRVQGLLSYKRRDELPMVADESKKYFDEIMLYALFI